MSNKLFRRGTALLLSAVLSFSLILPAAADEAEPEPNLDNLSVSFSDGTGELLLNESSKTVSAIVSGAPTGADLTYTYVWTSGNTAVARVSNTEETASISQSGARTGQRLRHRDRHVGFRPCRHKVRHCQPERSCSGRRPKQRLSFHENPRKPPAYLLGICPHGY